LDSEGVVVGTADGEREGFEGEGMGVEEEVEVV
jgi:hypothetical protein